MARGGGSWVVPSNLLISSWGNNFLTPAANFCDHMPCLFYQISKNFKNILSLKYFSLLILLCAKKQVIWCFSQICILALFVTKLILKTSKNLLKNKHKEAKYKTAIPMKFSSKFRLSTNVEKNTNFSLCFKVFWGGDEIWSLSIGLCDEIIHPQTVTQQKENQRTPRSRKACMIQTYWKEMAIRFFSYIF